jgi:hypothetical protein
MGAKDNWRRIGAGICLVAAPLLMLVGYVIMAGLRAGPFEDELEEVKGAADRWWTGTVIELVAITLLIGAVLAVIHLCRRGGADGFGLIGGTVTMIGLAAVIAIQSLELMLWLMAQPSQDAGAMQSLAVAVDDSNRMALLFLVSLGYFLGWVILAYALYRSEMAPTWVPAVLALGVIAFVGIIPGVDALVIIGAALQLIALGYLGLQAFQSAGPWSTTPEGASNAA